jgi:hypothetical protein
MRSLKLKEYKPANDKMKALLKWLWDVAVEPVLNDLHLTAPIPPVIHASGGSAWETYAGHHSTQPETI